MSSQAFAQPLSYSHSRYYSLDATRPPLPPVPFQNRPGMQSMLEASRRFYGHGSPDIHSPPPFPTAAASSSSAMVSRSPRPRLREEDMCPICRGMLPPKGVNGDETDRENHIIQCISQHDTSSPPPLQQRTRSNTAAHTFSNAGAFTSPRAPVSASLPTSPPPRAVPMQMLRFIATEKDCGIKTDGEGDTNAQPQECSICMVEYEVGERLVRLECWCKFHEECIMEWFGRKRECPVHKLS